jgi:hypothetical protein
MKNEGLDVYKKFLISEFWILSWNASVQRSCLYKKNTIEKDRFDFRKLIIEFAEEKLIPNYSFDVSEHDHLLNIITLSDFGTEIGEKVLSEDGYKIGVAQKMFNLQLKYLWCLGIVKEPPHCPIDAVIINKTPLRGTTAWTKIVTIDKYKTVISSVKSLAQKEGLSLSEWELANFDRFDA